MQQVAARDQLSSTLPAVGLQEPYYRARYYDPSAGRFTNEDPIGFNAGINSYEYSLNNPNNLTDPTGFNPLTDYICKHVKPPNVPQYPPFESPTETQKVLQNMKTADPFINAYNLFQLVRNTGPWNYKHGNPNYDAAGNFNYGCVRRNGVRCLYMCHRGERLSLVVRNG